MGSYYDDHKLLTRAKTKIVIIQHKNCLITMNNELVGLNIYNTKYEIFADKVMLTSIRLSLTLFLTTV